MATQRGKYAEQKVRDWLSQHAKDKVNFCFNRILDAHSARGMMANPQPGDFQWFADPFDGPRNGLIEVKEVAHEFRVPHKNFAVDQVGRMRIRKLAGSEPLVIVCFKMEGKPIHWCCPPFEFFEQREGGSWDLREFSYHSKVDTILEMHLP
jgi:hypothetical protein